MIPAPFEYRCPREVEEVVALLEKYGGSARLLAGGQSLIPLLRARSARPSVVLDLRRLEGLERIELVEEGLRIGPQATHRELSDSGLVGSRCPLLGEVAAQVGDPQIRNQGTLLGSLCHADPAGDYAAALVALRASVEIEGPRGFRRTGVDDFVRGAFETALEPDEMARAVIVPDARDVVGAYCKLPLGPSGFALAGVAVCFRMTDRTLRDVGVGVGGVQATPTRLGDAETQVLEQGLSADLLHAALSSLDPAAPILDDHHASASYRKGLVAVLLRRALATASDRAGFSLT